MSEILLQSIVEKLEAIEISLLKDNNPVKEVTIHALLQEIKLCKSDMVKLPLQFEKDSEKTSKLLQSILPRSEKSRFPKPKLTLIQRKITKISDIFITLI